MNIHEKMRVSLVLGLTCLLACSWAKDDKKEKDKEVGTVVGIDLGTTYSW